MIVSSIKAVVVGSLFAIPLLTADPPSAVPSASGVVARVIQHNLFEIAGNLKLVARRSKPLLSTKMKFVAIGLVGEHRTTAVHVRASRVSAKLVGNGDIDTRVAKREVFVVGLRQEEPGPSATAVSPASLNTEKAAISDPSGEVIAQAPAEPLSSDELALADPTVIEALDAHGLRNLSDSSGVKLEQATDTGYALSQPRVPTMPVTPAKVEGTVAPGSDVQVSSKAAKAVEVKDSKAGNTSVTVSLTTTKPEEAKQAAPAVAPNQITVADCMNDKVVDDSAAYALAARPPVAIETVATARLASYTVAVETPEAGATSAALKSAALVATALPAKNPAIGAVTPAEPMKIQSEKVTSFLVHATSSTAIPAVKSIGVAAKVVAAVQSAKVGHVAQIAKIVHPIRLPNLAVVNAVASSLPLVLGNISLRAPAVKDTPKPQANNPAPISMMFSNTDVSQALIAVGIRTGASIVYGAKDKISITLKLTATNVDDAVRAIASAGGLAYRKLDRVFVVSTPDSLKAALAPYAKSQSFSLPPGQAEVVAPKLQEALPYAMVATVGDQVVVKAAPEDLNQASELIQQLEQSNEELHPVVDVVMVDHASATDIGTAVKTIYPGLSVTSAAGPGGNSGLIRLAGPEALVRQAHQMILQLDDRAPGALSAADPVVVKVYHIKYTSAPELVLLVKKAMPELEAYPGPEVYQPNRAYFNPISTTFFGSGTQGSSGTSTTTTGTSTTTTGSTGSGSSSATQRVAGDRAADLVLRGPQSEVTKALALLEGVNTRPTQIEVDVTVTDVSPTFTENLGINWNLQNTQTVTESNLPNGINFGTFTRSPLSFQATLNASITKGEAKLLADPKVQVSDNNDASVFIGQTFTAEIPQVGALGAQGLTLQSFPVGIILLIRPRVNADGNITLHVNPVVSTVNSVDTNNVPQTSNREAETTVVVKDGETMVIGGLINDQFTRSINEVPFLSKIPLLGELFRNRNTTKTRQDVLVTITPHIVRMGGSQ